MICNTWHGMLYEMFCDASESVCRLRNVLFHLSPSNKIPNFSHANDGTLEAFEENRKLVWKLADSLTRLTSKAFFQLVSTNTVWRFWFAGRFGKLVAFSHTVKYHHWSGTLTLDDSQFLAVNSCCYKTCLFSSVTVAGKNSQVTCYLTVTGTHLWVSAASLLAGVAAKALRSAGHIIVLPHLITLWCVSHTHTVHTWVWPLKVHPNVLTQELLKLQEVHNRLPTVSDLWQRPQNDELT